MAKPKDWGDIASPEAVADQMNAIAAAQDLLAIAMAEAKAADSMMRSRRTLLENARNELGRMLKSRNDLEGSDFRVVHREETGRSPSHELFGIYSVAEPKGAGSY